MVVEANHSVETFLNYPVAQSLSFTANGTTRSVNLEEAVLPQDDVTGWPDRVPTFHGYSFTGSAEAEYVYVGRGQQVDFQRLLALNVSLEGKIALARYGGKFAEVLLQACLWPHYLCACN